MAAAGTEAARAKARTAELAREIRNAASPSAKLRKEFDAQRRKSRDLTTTSQPSCPKGNIALASS